MFKEYISMRCPKYLLHNGIFMRPGVSKLSVKSFLLTLDGPEMKVFVLFFLIPNYSHFKFICELRNIYAYVIQLVLSPNFRWEPCKWHRHIIFSSVEGSYQLSWNVALPSASLSLLFCYYIYASLGGSSAHKLFCHRFSLCFYASSITSPPLKKYERALLSQSIG